MDCIKYYDTIKFWAEVPETSRFCHSIAGFAYFLCCSYKSFQSNELKEKENKKSSGLPNCILSMVSLQYINIETIFVMCKVYTLKMLFQFCNSQNSTPKRVEL